jgi:hypothetical protein
MAVKGFLNMVMRKLILLLTIFMILLPGKTPKRLAQPIQSNTLPCSYLYSTFTNLSNPHWVPSLVTIMEDGYTKQFGLNSTEVAALDAAVQQLRKATVPQRVTLTTTVAQQFLATLRPQILTTVTNYANMTDAKSPAACKIYGTVYSDLNSIQNCLSGILPGNVSNGMTYCILAQGVPYPTDVPLTFTKSNYILTGSSNSPWATTIQRHNEQINNVVNASAGVTNVGIQNLTIDGNRFAFHFDQPTYWGCALNNGDAYANWDVDFGNASYAFLQNVEVINSPGSAVRIYTGSVLNSTVFSARTTGIQGGTNGVLNGSLNDGYVVVANSNLNFNGTAGVTMSGWGDITGNQFLGNRYEQPDGVPGGQLTVWNSASKVEIDGNYLNGYKQITPATGIIQTVNGVSGQLSGYSCPVTPDLGVDAIEIDGHSTALKGNSIINHIASSTGGGGTGIIMHQGILSYISALDPNTGLIRSISSNSYGIHIQKNPDPLTNIAIGVMNVTNNQVGILIDSGVTGSGFIPYTGGCVNGNGTNSEVDWAACDPSTSNLCYNPIWNVCTK